MNTPVTQAQAKMREAIRNALWFESNCALAANRDKEADFLTGVVMRAIAQHPDAQAGDFVMVPREPTHEMLIALGFKLTDGGMSHIDRYRERYTAMLAAAPAPAPAPEPAAEYSECSGDPRDCPENEGYGCCKPAYVEPAAPAICTRYRPGAPCPVPESCRDNGCSAVERELYPGEPAAPAVSENVVEAAKRAYSRIVRQDGELEDALQAAIEAANPALTARIAELESERAEIVKRLGCHPGMLLDELNSVTSRAEETPNADDYRQLQSKLTTAEREAGALREDAPVPMLRTLAAILRNAGGAITIKSRDVLETSIPPQGMRYAIETETNDDRTITIRLVETADTARKGETNG